MSREVKAFFDIAGRLCWKIVQENDEKTDRYYIFRLEKNGAEHRFGFLQNQSSNRHYYEELSNRVEFILVGDSSYNSDSPHSKGCRVPVIPSDEFIFLLTDWNMEMEGEDADETRESEETEIDEEERKKDKRKTYEEKTIHIIEENPIEQIYTQLRALTSNTIVEGIIKRHSKNKELFISEEMVKNKAKGVTYLIQNAIDYYDNASTQNMTQRMLNLYYGSIAFMEAEMLIYGDDYSDLESIEKITKNGHGLRTFGEARNLTDFKVGVNNKGLFYAWLKHRNIDVSDFPTSWDKCKKSNFLISLELLLSHIPELQNIMMETDKMYKPYFLFPSSDMTLNHTVSLRRKKEVIYKRKYYGNYIDFINLYGKTSKDIVESFLAPITIIGPYTSSVSGESGWRVFVRTKRNGDYYDNYHTHKGLSASQVIAPLFGKTDSWEVFAIMILYAMSIIVRYMPNLWARIMGGDLDRYKAVFYQFSRVAERELTQVFLEILTDKHVMIVHPNGLI